MRVLVVSGELISGDLAWRLQEEGCEVKLYVSDPRSAECQQGFVPRVDDWEAELPWVGKDGLIVFDDVKFIDGTGCGPIQDRLRREGYRVFGGSAGGSRLEQDRQYAQEFLSSLGLKVEPTLNFTSGDAAIAYVRANPARYVVKQNGHQSSLNYVGRLDDGVDVISLLSRYQRKEVAHISLQKVIDGVEIAIGGFFNGTDWVGSVNVNFEHKNLCNGDLGPQTGEMGTLMFYDGLNQDNALFRRVLVPITEYLRAADHRGYFDVNCIVTVEGIYPIDVTARLGCPAWYLQNDFHQSPANEFLSAVADGKPYDLAYRSGYGIVLTIALPPFPYEDGEILDMYASDDLEIFFRGGLTRHDRMHMHFDGVQRVIEDGQERLLVTRNQGYTLFITGFGESVVAARADAYARAGKVIIPKVFYRTDIGLRFMERDAARLAAWGYPCSGVGDGRGGAISNDDVIPTSNQR